MNILIIGFTTEGSTDVRFLESIIRRTFEEVAFECKGEILIHDVQHLEVGKDNFTGEVMQAARKAEENGIMVLCVHADADDVTDHTTFLNKIRPAFSVVEETDEALCKNLVAIVPIYMTEAWMLADKELLKEEIGTGKSEEELGLLREPESVADPKELIKEAIRIAFADDTRRRRNRSLHIAELYQPLGQKITLEKLKSLSSYQKFRQGVREAFIKLNYLH